MYSRYYVNQDAVILQWWFQSTIPSMPKRGNPDWGKPVKPGPVMPSEFELEAKRLRLKPETYVSSVQLRVWCEHNRNRCYIPEWLLKEWNIDVDSDLAPHRR